MGTRGVVLLIVAFMLAGTVQPLAHSSTAPGAGLAPPAPIEGIIVIDGDWDAINVETYRNATIYLTGNLTVANTAILTFQNTTLVMNISGNGQYNIEIDGVFIMEDLDSNPATQDDASVIMSNSTHNYLLYALSSSTVELRNSIIRDCGYSSGSNGPNIWTNNAVIDGMTFRDNYDGLFVRTSGAVVVNSTFLDNYRGLYVYFSEPTLGNLTVSGSASRGIYLYYSSPDLVNCTLANNTNGIYLWSSQSDIENCRVVDSSGAGIYAYRSSPLVKDSVLASTTDLEAVGESFPALLNTSFNESRVSLARGLYAHVGEYVDIIVEDANGTPQGGMTVSVNDLEGNPSDLGFTGPDGMAAGLALRTRILTPDGPLESIGHRFIAFSSDGTNITYGSNITGQNVSGPVRVTVNQNPAGIDFLPSGAVVDRVLNITGEFLMLGDVTIAGGGFLNASGSSIMMLSAGGLARSISLEGGARLDLVNSGLTSVGCAGPLHPGMVLVNARGGSILNVRDSTVRWASKLAVGTDQALVDGLDMSFVSAYGLEVGAVAPGIFNTSISWCQRGISLSQDSATLDGITVEHARDYGIYASQSDAVIGNLTVRDASKAAYLYYGEMSISGMRAEDCEYGMLAAYNLGLEVTDAMVQNASTYGLHITGSEFAARNLTVGGPGTGLHLDETDAWLQETAVGGMATAMEVSDCDPVLLNSSIGAAINIGRGASAALVNCSVDPALVFVEVSGHLDLGNWTRVRVVNLTGAPVPNCNVSVLDTDGVAAGSGITDGNGTVWPVSFREKRITWNRTVTFSSHKLLAFGGQGNLQGENITTMTPGGTAQVTVGSGMMGWYRWSTYRNIDACEIYDSKTIIAQYGASVVTGGGLTLKDSHLWFYGPGNNLHVDVKAGLFNMLENSTVTQISVNRPLQPTGYWIAYRSTATGHLENSGIHNPIQVTCFSDDIHLLNMTLLGAGESALDFEGVSPLVENCTIIDAQDGIWSDAGSPRVFNTTVRECAGSGIYLSGGSPEVRGSSLAMNYYGIQFTLGSDGLASNVTAGDNVYGIYVSSASPTLVDCLARDNENSGFYISDSHSAVLNSTASGSAYGMFCTNAWPDLAGCNLSGNSQGLYAYGSGPYLEDCVLEGNDIGFYSRGDAAGFSTDQFGSGRQEETANFVGGGSVVHASIDLPARAVVTGANLTVRGSEIGDDAVWEDDASQISPDIDGSMVVWQDDRNGNWDIYAYDLAADSDGDGLPNYLEPQDDSDPAMYRLTTDPDTQANPSVWGGTVVWTDLRNRNYDIYAYSFSNDTVWPVCTLPTNQRKPDIWGDHIVWEDDRNGNWDIYMLNISKGEVSRLSTSPRHDMGARIEGDRVVWYSYEGSPSSTEYSDIFLFDIDTWTLTQINKDDPLQYEPDIYGDRIFWHDNRNGNWDIYAYDIRQGTEERLTYGPEQSFCPSGFKDRVVYYYHDRILDTWSVHMYDMAAGQQTVLEEETGGDAHPKIYDGRVVWINKSGNANDIHALDLNLGGWPGNVTVDLGADGTAEFSWLGVFNTTGHVNETSLAQALNRALDRPTGGIISVPVRVSADSTGKVTLGPLEVEYRVPAYLVRTRITGSGQYGVRCYDSSPVLINSTLGSNPKDFHLLAGSRPTALNTSFNDSALSFGDAYSNLTVQNYLHIRCQNLSGTGLNATVLLTDNDREVLNTSVGQDGILMWSVVTHGRYNITGFHRNNTILDATYYQHWFYDTPRQVNMSTSHWEYLTTDTISPVISRPFPPPFWTYGDLGPVISARITDNVGIDLSTVRLYVEEFAVFYNAEPIPGGYNISYQHPVNFSDGQIVHCRLYGQDIYRNPVEYSWEFMVRVGATGITLSLLGGWNLISVPFDMYNQSVEATLANITGRYDMVMAYSPVNASGPWLSHVPGRSQSLNDLQMIDRKMGFWVHTTEPCTLSLSGMPITRTSIPLYAGWNLVGYPVLGMNQTVFDALWGTGADKVMGFDADDPYLLRELPPTYIMQAGEGYWVHVPADTVWVLDWGN